MTTEGPSRSTRLLTLIGAMALGILGHRIYETIQHQSVQSAAPIISIQRLGQLATLRVNYADIIEFTETRTFDVPWGDWGLSFGGTKVLLVARGNCMMATDLKSAKVKSVDNANRTLALSLPLPKTLEATVNHLQKEKGGSYFYAVNSQGVESLIPDGSNRVTAMEKALQFAQSNIAKACAGPAMQASAKTNTEEILNATLQPSGWKVAYEWF